MEITVDIPDTLAARLDPEADLPRRVLEALVLDAYRAGQLSNPELWELLGLQTRTEMDDFLKAHGVYEECTLEDVEDQVRAMQRLGF